MGGFPDVAIIVSVVRLSKQNALIVVYSYSWCTVRQSTNILNPMASSPKLGGTIIVLAPEARLTVHLGMLVIKDMVGP